MPPPTAGYNDQYSVVGNDRPESEGPQMAFLHIFTIASWDGDGIMYHDVPTIDTSRVWIKHIIMTYIWSFLGVSVAKYSRHGADGCSSKVLHR